MHAMLILVKVTVQISKTPDIKLYFKIKTKFRGGIVSMWWPYPADMILQLRPKLMQAEELLQVNVTNGCSWTRTTAKVMSKSSHMKCGAGRDREYIRKP